MSFCFLCPNNQAVFEIKIRNQIFGPLCQECMSKEYIHAKK